MSLLKGIVFIPREKDKKLEKTITTTASTKEKKESHDKKRKSKDHSSDKRKSTEVRSHKSHKKHKSNNKNIEKSLKSIKENEESSSSEDGDCDDFDEDYEDYRDFSKYQKELNLMAAGDSDVEEKRKESSYSKERIETTDNKSNKRVETTDCKSHETSEECTLKGKKSSFSSLINSLKSKTASQAESSSTNSPDNSKKNYSHDNTSDADDLSSRKRSTKTLESKHINEEHSNHCVEVLKDSTVLNVSISDTSRKHVTENLPVNEKSMNQSVAEQFRARLKSKNSFQSESRNLTQLIEDEDREIDNDQLFENDETMRAQVLNKMKRDIGKNNGQTELDIKNYSKPSKSVEIDLKNQRKEFVTQRSDINKLMQSEKFGQNDMDENFRENVLRLGERYKGTELGKMGAFGNGDLTGQDEEEEIDMKMFGNRFEVDSDNKNRKSKKQILKKIGNDNRRDGNGENEKLDAKQREIINRCLHCSDNSNFKRHLTVSKGEHTILRLKSGSNVLGPMHCMITPITHTASFLQCEDEVEIEVTRYKSCLQRMYERDGQSVLFLESALGFGKHPHACIDVVPIPLGMEGEARMSFREVSTRTCMCTYT